MCKTSSTEQSRATLHGAGAKTGAWTMEGLDNLVQHEQYTLCNAPCPGRERPTQAEEGLQQCCLCRIMNLYGRRRSRSASALPPNRSLPAPRGGQSMRFVSACRSESAL